MQRIVVGVDGSEGARAALVWAVEEARLRGATIEAVLCWHVPYVGGTSLVPLSGVSVDPAELEKSYRVHLDRIVDEATRDMPPAEGGVPIEGKLVHGSASSVLLEVAVDADLLVVGSRGHGGFTGLLLGSVTHQVIGHSPCPVVVIPPPDKEA